MYLYVRVVELINLRRSYYIFESRCQDLFRLLQVQGLLDAFLRYCLMAARTLHFFRWQQCTE